MSEAPLYTLSGEGPEMVIPLTPDGIGVLRDFFGKDLSKLTERFEVYRDKTTTAKRWRWRLVAHNGELIADSGQGYSRRWNAVRAAHRINPDTEIVIIPDESE